MILYLDTSALVKRYFKEEYSTEVIDYWTQAEEIITSCVTYAETMASFWRKKREGPTSDELIQKVVELFKRDWESFVRVEVNEDLNQYVDLLVERHPLRGFDAIHLASVKVIHDSLPGNLIFLCFDRRLASAAHEEGLKIFGEGCEE